MRAIVFWNILAIICLGFPAFVLISACLEILTSPYLTMILSMAVSGMIFLIALVFAILVANVITLFNEDKEKSKKVDLL